MGRDKHISTHSLTKCDIRVYLPKSYAAYGQSFPAALQAICAQTRPYVEADDPDIDPDEQRVAPQDFDIIKRQAERICLGERVSLEAARKRVAARYGMKDWLTLTHSVTDEGAWEFLNTYLTMAEINELVAERREMGEEMEEAREELAEFLGYGSWALLVAEKTDNVEERWKSLQVERTLRNKWIATHARTIDDCIDALKARARTLRGLQEADAALVDGVEQDYATFFMQPEQAEKVDRLLAREPGQAAHGPGTAQTGEYVREFYFKFMTVDAQSLDDMAAKVEYDAKEFQEMQQAGVWMAADGAPQDGIARLYTDSLEVAARFGFDRIRDYFGQEEESEE